MATGKRYYWIKLKDSFMNSEVVDFLMSQPNGASYVVLYQMLCLKTINTDGRLTCQIGDIIVPFDIGKIQRDCKYFTLDTIRVALGLYKQLGLIYEEQDGTLVLVNHAEMVGSETDYSAQKRMQRENRRRQIPVQCADSDEDNSVDIVHTDIRDKRKDIRDIENRDKDICFDKSKPTKHKYGEYHHVLLDDNQYERLKKLYGNSLDEHIRILDEYIETSGKKYKNHSLVIQKWVHERYLKDHKNNEHVQLDSKFYAQESNQTQEEINKEMERVRREILGNVA